MYDFAMPLAFGELPSLLRLLREDAGMTQEEAGAAVGMSHQSVGNWEKGSREPPFAKLSELLAAYGVDDFAQLQRALEAMRRGKGERLIYDDAAPKPKTAEEMLANAPAWTRFAIEGMAGRLSEYEEEIRRLRGGETKGPQRDEPD